MHIWRYYPLSQMGFSSLDHNRETQVSLKLDPGCTHTLDIGEIIREM